MDHPTIGQLQVVPLFSGLSLEQLELLRGRLDVQPFTTGAVLAREGDSGYAFYRGAGRRHPRPQRLLR
jgi:hypothetical protein